MFTKHTNIIPVFYKKKLKNNWGGKAYGFWIVIDERYRNDIGLHRHELQHCKRFFQLGIPVSLLYFSTIALLGLGSNITFLFNYQSFINFVVNNPLITFTPFLLPIHNLLYRIKRFRLWSEIDAYAVQLKYTPAKDDLRLYMNYYARILAEKYNLGVNKEEAFRLLRKKYYSKK